jgi:hypothetical protein
MVSNCFLAFTECFRLTITITGTFFSLAGKDFLPRVSFFSIVFYLFRQIYILITQKIFFYFNGMYIYLHQADKKHRRNIMQLQRTTPTEAMQLGKIFTESGMFPDIKSAQMAVVKIMAGQEMGIGPFQAMNGIHIIQGKATVGAGLMASQVKSSGKYDYKVLQQDDKACIIEFMQGKESIGVSKFTIEDAKKAGTKNLDKYPANMLFARAMSNGVKWYTPDVFNGPVYTPDEIQVEETTAEVVMLNPDVVDALTVLDGITDLDTLKQWKATFADVIKVPQVKAASMEKYYSLVNEAK